MTEADLAMQRADLGDRVRRSHGRYWAELRAGFYEPIHPLARLRRDEARRPGLCWGFRCALRDADVTSAEASVPVHLLTDLAGFGWHSLPNDSRRYLRKFPDLGITLVRVTDPTLLERQGYDVMLDWRTRLGLTEAPPSRERYARAMRVRVSGAGWMTLAGLQGDRLLGYMSVWLVDDTAYLQDSKVHSEALKTRLGTAMDYEALLALQRSGSAREVCAGFHSPERPQLTEYKLRHGFAVVQVPGLARLPWPIGELLRRRKPGTYYRLTGRAMGSPGT
jgi:hypothetical protein